MRQLINVPLDDTDHVLIEVDGPDGVVPAGPGRVVATAGQTMEQIFTRVQPVIKAVAGKIRSLPDRPDRVSVEFGVTLTAEAGVIIARTATEANFRLTMEWQQRPPEPGSPS